MSAVRLLDADAVAAALTPSEAVAAIEAVLRAGFDPANDAPRTVHHTRHGHLLLMPAELGAHVGAKVASVAPDNPASGLPRIQASYLLLDAVTLTVRAILDGTALTTLRTPAVSLAGVRSAVERIDHPLRVVVFGAGPQAVGHVATLEAVTGRPVAALTVVTRDSAWSGAPRTDVRRVAAGSREVDDAVAGADVVVCATTAREPLFAADAVAAHAVVIAVGSHEADARELDPHLLARATVVVEDVTAALREAGDVVLARDEGHLDVDALLPMRDVVTGVATLPSDRPVVMKSVGMSWEDLAVAGAVFTRSG